LKRRIFEIPKRIEKLVNDYLSLPELVRNISRTQPRKKSANYSSAIIAAGFLVSGAIIITTTLYGLVLFAGGAIFTALSFKISL